MDGEQGVNGEQGVDGEQSVDGEQVCLFELNSVLRGRRISVTENKRGLEQGADVNRAWT